MKINHIYSGSNRKHKSANRTRNSILFFNAIQRDRKTSITTKKTSINKRNILKYINMNLTWMMSRMQLKELRTYF